MKVDSPAAKPIYTCPMHPEVQQDHPGNCPKCGMALEPKTVTAGTDEEENAELRDMTKRFWIGVALALPVFVLAMAHLIPDLGRQPWVDGNASRWIQCALATPAVWWAGWPLLHRGWRSVVTRHLNTFTLIAIGVGAAFVLSAVAMIMGNIRQDLIFAFLYNALRMPVAAGLLYPFFGLLLSPIIAGAAMSLSSVSVLSNALRLRTVRL